MGIVGGREDFGFLGGGGGGKGDFIWILSSVFLDGINVGNEVP